MSTLPCWMTSSRTFDGVSTHSILSAEMPSLAAICLAISTSNPVGVPSRPFRPNSGWSNLVPILILPSLFSFAIVVPSSNLAPWFTGGLLPPPESDFPHAAIDRARAAVTAPTIRPRSRICAPSFPRLYISRSVESMGKDLAKEVFGPVGFRRGEELVRRAVLDDLAVRHENHPVRGVSREAHLVRDP